MGIRRTRSGYVAAIGLEKLPRKAFDAVERPVTKVAETTVQSDAFMDALALTWKLQRRGARRVQAGACAWLRLWGLPTHRDVGRLAAQVGGLQRELRELRRELESRR
jgi:hypothetical protein